MKFNQFSFGIAILSAFALASCEFTGGSSGGTQVKNPTVDEMTEMEKEWGVEPHTTRPRQSAPSVGSQAPFPVPPSAPTRALAPQPVPAPLPQTQTDVPPLFEQPPPSASPDQVQ